MTAVVVEISHVIKCCRACTPLSCRSVQSMLLLLCTVAPLHFIPYIEDPLIGTGSVLYSEAIRL